MSEKNPFKAGKFEPSPEQQRQLEVFSRRLEAIAKQVSGDSTLHVAPGKPGSGEWYFKPDTNEIRWDPAEVLMKAEDAEEEVMGKMAHEGGHRAVTRWRDVVDMKQLKETLGLHAVLAAVEERPTDQVVRDRYEGAGRWLNAARQGSIREGAEARERAGDMGYVPKFSQLCSFITYEPYYESRQEDVSDEVYDFYEEIRGAVERIEHLLPPKGSSNQRVIDDARTRHEILMTELWPKIKELAEEDLQMEKERQVLVEEMRKALSGEETELDKKVLEELLRSIIEQIEKETLRRMTEEEKKIEEMIKQMEEGGDEVPEGLLENMDAEELKEKLNAKLGDGSGGIPIPMDKLSQKAREAAKEIYDAKGEKARRDLDKKAEQSLEDLEDMVVEDIAGDLGDRLPTHQEMREMEDVDDEDKPEQPSKSEEGEKKEEDLKRKKEEEQEKERKRRKEEERERDKERGEMRKKLKELQKNRSEYDKTYQKIREYDDELYHVLDEHFFPTQRTKRELKVAGSRINIPAVFKWDATRKAGGKNIPAKIFETTSTPEELDHSVTILVDLSGSMSGEKIDETFKGVVLLSEVLNRLGVKLEVLGFQDEVIEFKSFDDELTNKVRKKMSGMVDEVYDRNPGGHNFSGCNDDGPCLREASDRLADTFSQNKILIVLSDGLPAGIRSTREDLEITVEHIIQNTDQRLIGVGLGAGTEHVEGYYPISAPNLRVDQIAEQLGGLIALVMTNPEALKVSKPKPRRRF